MKVRVLGGGWFGAHLTIALLEGGHDVELHESADRLFAGASGANPARLHQGPHYPRSGATRAACQAHNKEFMAVYGHLTRGVPVNVYAVARDDSLVDFATYCKVLEGEVPFLEVYDPSEFGLRDVEGAILVGERHMLIDKARAYFTDKLGNRVRYGVSPVVVDDPRWHLTIDCTFCALDSANVDRYEPCLTALLEGPAHRAVTIMDGPFPSIFPWDESRNLSSLTSASLTPFSKTCRTWHEARGVLDALRETDLYARGVVMLRQMGRFWPEALDIYRIAECRTAIRAMPKSRADSRLVDVIQVGERALRVRAGKIDAIFQAARQVAEFAEALPKRRLRRAA